MACTNIELGLHLSYEHGRTVSNGGEVPKYVTSKILHDAASVPIKIPHGGIPIPFLKSHSSAQTCVPARFVDQGLSVCNIFTDKFSSICSIERSCVDQM